MKLKIEIKMDNAAFEPEGNIEAAHMLRDLADAFEEGADLQGDAPKGMKHARTDMVDGRPVRCYKET